MTRASLGPARACVDASLALACLFGESAATLTLWRQWAEAGVEICSPPLFFAEMTSVLRRKLAQGALSAELAQEAFALFEAMPVRQVDPPDLQRRAWDLARVYARPTAYDCQYLAVAQHLGCELWTCDGRLVRSANEPWVRHVG